MKNKLLLTLFLAAILSGCSAAPKKENAMCLDVNNKPVLAVGETGLVNDDYFYCNDNAKLEAVSLEDSMTELF